MSENRNSLTELSSQFLSAPGVTNAILLSTRRFTELRSNHVEFNHVKEGKTEQATVAPVHTIYRTCIHPHRMDCMLSSVSPTQIPNMTSKIYHIGIDVGNAYTSVVVKAPKCKLRFIQTFETCDGSRPVPYATVMHTDDGISWHYVPPEEDAEFKYRIQAFKPCFAAESVSSIPEDIVSYLAVNKITLQEDVGSGHGNLKEVIMQVRGLRGKQLCGVLAQTDISPFSCLVRICGVGSNINCSQLLETFFMMLHCVLLCILHYASSCIG